MSDNNGNYGFYYSRKERLEKAPEPVRELYSEDGKQKKGIFKVLLATKSSRFLFFAIIIICVSGLFLSLFSKSNGYFDLGIYEGKIFAFEFEGKIYLSMELFSQDNSSAGNLLPFTVNFLSEKQIVSSEDFEYMYLPDQPFDFKYKTEVLKPVPDEVEVLFYLDDEIYKIKTSIKKNLD